MSIAQTEPSRSWPEPAPGDWDYRAVGPIPFADFVAELLALYVPPLRSRNTWLKMRQTLAIVADLLGDDATTDGLTPQMVALFIESRPEAESPRTTHALLAYLRVSCTYAKSQGYIRTSPFDFRKVWLRKGRPEPHQHHTRDEIRRVLELLESEALGGEGWARWRARRLHAMAALFAFTGLRRNEGLYLHAADVDLEGRMIHLVERRERRLKTEASAQPVPIPPPLAPILADWLSHRLDGESSPGESSQYDGGPAGCPYLFPGVARKGPWTGGPRGHQPVHQLQAAGERAGVQRLTFLSLRHTFATLSPGWGLSELQIQRVLRHTSLSTQEYYRHADLDGMRDSVARIDFGPARRPDAEGGPGDATS
jgi:integrase